VIAHNRKNSTQLWGETDGKWKIVANSKSRGSYYNPEVVTYTTPDGSRTFAVIDQFNGMQGELLELHPDRMEKITALGRGSSLSDPFTQFVLAIYAGALLSPLAVMGLMVLAATWLMATHREPCYFKGRISVRFASLLRRCVAVLLDVAFFTGPMFLGWYLWYRQHSEVLTPLFDEIEDDPQPFFMEFVPVLWASIGWLTTFAAVSWLMLAWGGFTIGKWLCGVRVARTTLEPPGLLRALVRMIIWPVETGMFHGIVAFSLVAFTLNRQRLADLIGGCVVLRAGSLRQARAELAAKTLESRL
jgi:uncharacterized RDD family membrane protein YckC